MRHDQVKVTISIAMLLAISAMTILADSNSSISYQDDIIGSDLRRIEIPLMFEEPDIVIDSDGFAEITLPL